MNSFQKSDIIQILIARHLEPTYGQSFTSVGNFASYDISFKDKTLEVKVDFRASESANAAIEFSSNGRPSGIANTKASHWLHCLPTGEGSLVCYEIEVPVLRRICIESASGTVKGNSGSCGLKLIPLAVLRQNSCRHFTLQHPLLKIVLEDS